MQFSIYLFLASSVPTSPTLALQGSGHGKADIVRGTQLRLLISSILSTRQFAASVCPGQKACWGDWRRSEESCPDLEAVKGMTSVQGLLPSAKLEPVPL